MRGWKGSLHGSYRGCDWTDDQYTSAPEVSKRLDHNNFKTLVMVVAAAIHFTLIITFTS